MLRRNSGDLVVESHRSSLVYTSYSWFLKTKIELRFSLIISVTLLSWVILIVLKHDLKDHLLSWVTLIVLKHDLKDHPLSWVMLIVLKHDLNDHPLSWVMLIVLKHDLKDHLY